MVLALLATAGVARAGDIPDASLRAVKDRVVRLQRDNAPELEGRLLGFEPQTITIALSTTKEVVSVEREHVTHVIVLDDLAPATAPAQPERTRMIGVQMSLLGTLAVDADYKWLHGFASTSLLLPIATAQGGGSAWYAGAAGAGVAIPMGTTSRWKLDVFAELLPFHTTSFYTYLGIGTGAGFHYTSASGFTIGFTMPVIGFSARLGSSPTGYDAPFRYNDSLKYFYASGLAGMPIVTLGYRFATNCSRR